MDEGRRRWNRWRKGDQHFSDRGQIVARDIPDGWCRCADFDERKAGDPYRAGPAGDYQIILNACNAGTIRAYKENNRWVVNRDDAELLVRSSKASKPQTASKEKTVITSTIGPKKPASSDVEKITQSLDEFSEKVESACDSIHDAVSHQLHSIAEQVHSIAEVLCLIRDAIADLKTPASVETKTDMGPY